MCGDPGWILVRILPPWTEACPEIWVNKRDEETQFLCGPQVASI